MRIKSIFLINLIVILKFQNNQKTIMSVKLTNYISIVFKILFMVYIMFNLIMTIKLYSFESKHNGKADVSISNYDINKPCIDCERNASSPVMKVDHLRNLTNSKVFIFMPFKWIINNQVYQYSSYLIKTNRTASIEAIIGLRKHFSTNFIKSRFRCLVKSLDDHGDLSFTVSEIYNYSIVTKKVICVLRKTNTLSPTISIAVVNLDDYVNDDDMAVFRADKIKDNVIQLPKYTIVYQTPVRISKQKKKEPSMAHCVHLAYNINHYDIKKILTWMGFQKQFGISKVIIHDANQNSLFHDQLYSTFDRSFLEIRPYKIEYEAICDQLFLDHYKRTNLLLYTLLKDNCEDAYYKFFSNPIANAGNRWKHQKINANDCYTHFKYTYELVSLYDFDELIYPRNFVTNSSSITEFSCHHVNGFCKFQQQLTLYDYVKNVVRQSGRRTKWSSVYFLNAIYLNLLDYHVENFFKNLKNLTSSKYNVVSAKPESTRIQLLFTSKNGHYFKILPNDMEHVRNLIRLYDKLKCVYGNFNGNLKNLDNEFKRFLFVITGGNHRMGKSVHNTDNVDAIFTHYATKTKHGAHSLKVSPNYGLLSHFRIEHYTLALNFETSIQNLAIDYEYYFGLLLKYGIDLGFKCH
jgi:hypothetical protein